MPNVFNIFNIKINNVSSNGSVNMGNTILRGNSADSKEVGGNSVIGDASPAYQVDRNVVSDPDLIDQPTSSL
ncbi:spore gernimation protein [Paenibacillus swuensis]|uniref:Spore gernimation protein n=1 Tax=Paenibacillus swuensis TaxID=1178515 RepID=A0A172TEF5_9BACL|nr:spore germination protein [Paenibacillus swuensis]ANE45445.1 spore gernimation protein [Paenibacillus swuensis]